MWLCVKGCFIHKKEDSKDIKQFWTILLLNVVGKIFFGILSKRPTTLLLANNYTNIVYVRWSPKDAKWNKADLAVLWVSHTNVYGMMHQKLVETTSKVYHIPNKFHHQLQGYFNHLKTYFTCSSLTWWRIEIGIITMCTISLDSLLHSNKSPGQVSWETKMGNCTSVDGWITAAMLRLDLVDLGRSSRNHQRGENSKV